MPRCLIGIEAGMGTHYVARDLNVGFVPIANIGANLKVYLVRWRRRTAGERVHPLMRFFYRLSVEAKQSLDMAATASIAAM